MSKPPNIIYVLSDQVRAASLPIYGERQIETPHLDRLASEGITYNNALSPCPVCTPYRAMFLTGTHCQTNGHIMNFVRSRHDEIGIGDVFSRAGYRTGYVGKWHHHTGVFPAQEGLGAEYIPEGRDRLGFDFWRAYNYRTQYFDGLLSHEDWRVEKWEGYETDALHGYAEEFLDWAANGPFFLVLSPHQAHNTSHRRNGLYAPSQYYQRLPEQFHRPANVPEAMEELFQEMMPHYMAMILALDDMLGDLLATLDRRGLGDDTLLIFTSDHGTQGGAQGLHPWAKKVPYEESLRVPLVARWPGRLPANRRSEALVSPVDMLPTLAALAGVAIPSSIEGKDLSRVWKHEAEPGCNQEVLTANFTSSPDFAVGPEDPRYRPEYMPWRGVRTTRHHYIRWHDGRQELYDLQADPLQMDNLADSPGTRTDLEPWQERLARLLRERADTFPEGDGYRDWFDEQRRVVRNAHGPLGDPETPPDWQNLTFS